MPERRPNQAPVAIPAVARALAEEVRAAGGALWLVGGWVRDALLGRESKDLDLEAHGLEPRALERALRRVGPAHQVGRSFGVYKVRVGAVELDVSLAEGEGPPSREGLREAARRRDLTINAMAADPLTGELEDPWGGREDLAARRLRAVDETTFLRDPLRALRVVQFAARFGFSVEPSLERLCRTADLREVAPERVAIELEKLLLGAPEPGRGLAMSRAWGLLAMVLPEVGDDPGVDAPLDRAATRRDRQGDAPRPLALMLAALLHRAGSRAAEAALDRCRWHTQAGWPLKQRVCVAVARWPELVAPVDDVALRALAETSALALTAETAWAATGAAPALEALARADAMGIGEAPLLPLLQGRDLRDLGVKPGPEMGRLIARVREAQIQGIVNSPQDATALVQRWLSEVCPSAVVD